jgi:ABC-type branched-subunit amino acid transport system substrate-binding protein
VRRLAYPAALAAALAVLPAAFAGSSATPGVTDTRILIGGTVPLSGPAAPFGIVGPGADAYFEYVNDHGGVNGRKIDYEYLDDAYDPAQTVQLTRKLVQQDRVLAIFNTVGTDNNIAIQKFLNDSKVPQLFGGTGTSRIGRAYKKYPWSMGYLPSFAAEGRIYGRYLARTAPRARVGVLYENSDFGKDLLHGLQHALSKGAKLVSAQKYEITDTDVSSQIARLRRSKADTLMLFATPKYAIQSFSQQSRLGWKPRVFITSVSVEPTVMRVASLASSNRTEGALSIAFVKDPTSPRWTKDPAVKLYRKIMRRYDPSGKPTDVYNYYGMTVAYTMVDALRKAGKNLTRQSLLRAATHLDEKNPFLRPAILVRTSPSNYFPITKAQLIRYHNGLWVEFGALVSAHD